MACINPDGSITRPGRKMMEAMSLPKTLEDVAKETAIPVFRIRSVIRELLEAEYVEESEGLYSTTEKGRYKLEK